MYTRTATKEEIENLTSEELKALQKDAREENVQVDESTYYIIINDTRYDIEFLDERVQKDIVHLKERI